MGFSVTSLKRSNADTLSKLASEISSSDQRSFKKDERYWQPEADKSGKGEATIRFLDRLSPEAPVFVKLYANSIDGSKIGLGNKWYIENSRNTLGEDDPVSEHFFAIRKPDTKEAKAASQPFSRKLYYISNVLVINDPAHPENNGKVFLYRYGKMIFDMISDKAEPKFEGDVPQNVFDLYEGSNFHLRFYKASGFRKYDKSVFAAPSPIAATEEEIIALLDGKGYDLQAEVSPDKFKSYEELRKKFHAFLNGKDDSAAAPATAAARLAPKATAAGEADEMPWDEPKSTTTRVKPQSTGDADMDIFANLANED